MPIIKWAAVALTVLMGLMNLGQITGDLGAGGKVLGVILAAGAVVAIVAFLSGRSWGRAALIGIGLVNVAAGIGGAIADVDGWPIGLVVAAVGAALAAVHRPSPRPEPTT